MKRPAKRELRAFGWRVIGFAVAAIVLLGVVAILGFGASDDGEDSPVPPRPRASNSDSVRSAAPGGDPSQPAPAGQQPSSGDSELRGERQQDRERPGDQGPDDGDGGNREADDPSSEQADPPPAVIDTPGNGKSGPTPVDTPAAEAPGPVEDITGPVGGVIDDVGKGADKALWLGGGPPRGPLLRLSP
jgi:hypothetical protein